MRLGKKKRQGPRQKLNAESCIRNEMYLLLFLKINGAFLAGLFHAVEQEYVL